MQLEIKILGANCSKCNKLENRVIKIIDEYKINATVSKITDTIEFSKYNILVIPALIINEKLVFKGSLPSKYLIVQEINKHLS
ncbi:MAG: thioredoxin family protein, partial [Bacteroidetes bacterium]|nr:thioredoxin family protein [Bacteroidota bacterium]